jgi:peptidoglycan/xylan/chitin deacetylase (PgdA/CDA1 family)
MQLRLLLIVATAAAVLQCNPKGSSIVGQTEILKWYDGKKAAISLTYDDGSANQFRVALPIMDSLGFPATFYINTGVIKGSKYPGAFIGRDVRDIIKETESTPTNAENLFERASAIGFIGDGSLLDYHTRAGSTYEYDNAESAFPIIDEAYEKVRAGEVKLLALTNASPVETGFLNWDMIREIAATGHEFGSHTITHPRLAVLDEANLLYELEKSREDILENLGADHTFSAECPYGTENERVMEYAYPIYPALRNRMPEPFLEELNRSNSDNPGASDKEYVQWQRGPLTATPMELMKSWVDTCLIHDNLWLVLVFHGVEGVGWEPKTRQELLEYFSYIKSFEDQVWVATFRDATKYMQERMSSEVQETQVSDKIIVEIKHDLEPDLYNFPLTLKTYIPDTWDKAMVSQEGVEAKFKNGRDETGRFVIYDAIPNSHTVEITEG